MIRPIYTDLHNIVLQLKVDSASVSGKLKGGTCGYTGLLPSAIIYAKKYLDIMSADATDKKNVFVGWYTTTCLVRDLA